MEVFQWESTRTSADSNPAVNTIERKEKTENGQPDAGGEIHCPDCHGNGILELDTSSAYVSESIEH
jgi:hypothetical protein